MQPLRILFVLEYFWPQIGGVESLFYNLARELVERGHRCTVLTTRLQSTPAREEHMGISIYRIGNPERASRYAFTFAAIPSARALARSADILHTTTYNAAPPAWLVGRLTGKPTLITVHEVLGAAWRALPDTNWLHATALQTLERLAVALPFDHYVAVSRATRNALRQTGVPDHQLSFVYNGHDTLEWQSDPERRETLKRALNPHDVPLVGFYGRPGVTKGVEVLIEAFLDVRRRIPRAQLLLILGNYPSERRERLIRLAQERLADAVTILPSVPREQLADYLSLCDCIAVPSLTEGFGFTTIEAASLGRVVVASDVGSIPEVISGRYVLAAPNDARAFGEALCTALLTDVPSSLQRVFTTAAMADGYEATYARLQAARPAVISRQVLRTDRS